ncbi:amino acid ABC transporter permease [Mycobacterium sp. 21AC1]|uniref:amino acid ABC transporter permease n=1 Tax=[Mycobacterium] appelbergii TaxID=2939269 RepID=UPI002938FE06|nr:amino acid ABC transporter permease [Mycobacterium sp. 21AC1]MDV3128936.1 amino acid ABC transporter permease [Mycobacterium sp. 21AC1]
MNKTDWGVIWDVLPNLLEGLKTSLAITLLVIVISAVAAVPVALARMAEFDLIRWIAQGYIELFRCTPVLIQLFWMFYALPILLDIRLSGFVAAVIAISANLTAQVAEVYRAGFQSVPAEQLEAAKVLQVDRYHQVVSIIVPQTLRQQLPALLTIAINGFKDTALVSVIGVVDLMFAANTAAAQTYRSLEILTGAAVVYFVVAFPLSLLVSHLERRRQRQDLAPASPKHTKQPVIA